MSVKDRQEAHKDALRRRQEEGYNRKDDSGLFKSIYKPETKKDLFWKCTEGEHSINILPYNAGDRDNFAKKGEETYCCEIWVHTNVGANKDSYICMKRTFKQQCAECDFQDEMRQDPNCSDEEVKKLSPSRRVIYNIELCDSDASKGKVMLFEASHWLFEKNLLEASKKRKGGGYIYFADRKDGKIVGFKRTGMGPTNTSFTPFSFEDREEPPSKELLSKVYCLDELLHYPEYEEVYAARYGKEKAKQSKVEEEDGGGGESDPDVGDGVLELGEEECPIGKEFGRDNAAYEDCTECQNFDPCADKYKELEEEEEARIAAEEEARIAAEKEKEKKKPLSREEIMRQRAKKTKETPPTSRRSK